MTAPHEPTPSWLAFARQVVEYAARRADPARAGPAPAELRAHHGVFVTLHKYGRLRGCMGTLDPHEPLVDAVRHAAVCAASQDPRFTPVTPDELPDLQIEVSILSPPRPMGRLEDLEIGRHGVIVRRGKQRGLFLPQVAVTHHFDKETFLARCCSEKAGLPSDSWRDPETEVLLFTAEVM
ncbi:MAG: AmmeMemoRadiSam system protein A [Phycisphaerae bacterium]|nr:AmmeMemoRadiSam system protein A [Phycisphaerae bacterium]